MIRRFLVPAVLIALVAGVGWVLFRPKPPAPVAWQGYAEADFVKVGPTQAGLLTAVRVARGDRVVKGQPLFEQDDADDRAAVEQARRLLQQARGQLANLMSPAKASEIDQAEANLRDAQAARDRAQEDLRRSSQLLKSGSATQQIVDQEEAALRSAEAKVAAATAALATAQAPMGRPSEVEAQQSMVDALEAALKQAQWRLDQRSVGGAGGRDDRRRDRLPRRDALGRRAGRVAAAARATSSSASSFPSRNSRKSTSATGVDFACDNCPADLDGDGLVHLPERGIHAAVHLFSESNRASSSSSPRRARRRIRRGSSIRASP